MKKYNLAGLLILIMTLHVYSESSAIKLEDNQAQKFLMNLHQMLIDVSPKYSDHQKKFQDKIFSLKMKVRNLDIKYSQGIKKGQTQNMTREEFEAEFEKLIDEAMDDTQAHLKELIKTIDANRKTLKQKLMPKEK